MGLPAWPDSQTLWFWEAPSGELWAYDWILDRVVPLIGGEGIREIVDELFDPGYTGPV